MDDTRFDDFAKVLGSVKSRRLAIGALLGGGLSALGMPEAEAKKKNNDNDKDKKKKCKKKAGPCEKCNNKGKRKPKANGTACTPPGGVTGQCANGACIATSPPVPPAPPSPLCVTQGNPCTQTPTTPAATCCAGTVCGRAFGAAAGTFNCCNGPGTTCSAATASQCCSGGCNTNTAPPTCVCKTAGTACDDNSQCCSNRCLSGTCAAAQSARG